MDSKELAERLERVIKAREKLERERGNMPSQETQIEDVYGDEIRINIVKTDVIREQYDCPLIDIKISQGYFLVGGLFKPEAAREIAARLVALADEIEGGD